MEAAPVEMVSHLGELGDFSSKGLTAWKRTRGPTALMLKAADTSLGSTADRGVGAGQMPALAMTRSRWLIPAASMSLTAADGSVVEVLSMETRSRREPAAAGRALSSWTLGADVSRTLPMTVWFGRERYVCARALPIPGCSQYGVAWA